MNRSCSKTERPGGEARGSCTIREAVAKDAAAIESLYRELVSDPHIRVLPEQIAELGRSPRTFLLVAEADGTVSGTVLFTLCLDVMYGTQPFGVVENMVVANGKRGQGVGRRLLAHVEQLAMVHDCTKLMLLSTKTRQDAHAFFQDCGFAGDTKKGFVKYRRHFAVGPNEATTT